MKSEDFLRSLRNSKILPDDIMGKLETKLERTDKHVTPKSIAKYLMDKGLLSRYQAKQLLTGELTPADDIEIQVSHEESQDTDELLRDLNPPAPDDATRTESAIPQGRYDESIEVVQVEHEATMQQGLNPDMTAMPDPGQLDPLGGFGFDQPEHDTVEEVLPTGSFAGKKARTNQWESKWLFIGTGLLGFFILAGIILAVTLFKTDATKMWDDALGDFNKGLYQSALPKLLNYVKDYPGDEKIADARIKIANCELRIPYDAEHWGNTLGAAQSVLPRLETELEDLDESIKFEDLRSELSVILPGTAIGFTQEAMDAPDVATKQSQLDLAIETRTLIDNSNYVPGSYKRNPGVSKVLQDLTNNIAIVERQIKMENEYSRALVDIANLTSDGKTKNAFEAYDSLTGVYPELAIRPEMRDTVAAISDREAELVVTMDSPVAETTAPPNPIGASLIFGTRTGQTSIPGMGERMLVTLVEGALFGIRAETGEIVWRKFVGLETTTQPMWIDEEKSTDLIAVDSRFNHVMSISAATGDESWRMDVGEPFSRPNVSPDRILITTLSGKIISIDPETGASSDAAQLPQQADVAAVAISQSPLVYQVGHNSNLYVISTETMTCREVFFVGHRPGSVIIPPFVMSEHLIIAENGADYCKLHILRPTENGLLLEKAQPSIRLDGQVTEPIVRYGRWGLVVSDEGDLRMLELNKANEAEPVTVVVRKRYSPSRRTRKFLLADNGQLWNAAAGLRRYKIQKAAGEFKEERVENSLDTFIAPLALINETLFDVRRRHDSALVSVSAVDSLTLEEIWRNDFAAPLAGVSRLGDSRLTAVTSQGDVFDIDETVLQQGVANSPVSRGSTVVQTLVFDHVLQFDDQRFVAVGPPERSSIINVDSRRNPPVQLSDLKSPANRPACRPVRFGDYLLVAALRGQVFRIDPLTGNPLGSPFQPELQPNVEVQWREPAILVDGELFVIGNAKGDFFLVAAQGETSLIRVDQITHERPLISPLISRGGAAIGVCRDDNGDQLVMLIGEQKLTMEKTLDLPGGYVSGPIAMGNDNFLLTLDSGKTVCYDGQLNQVWQARIPPEASDKMAGPPVMADGNLVIAFESGLIATVDPASGDVTDSWEIGQPISAAPFAMDDFWLVPGIDGTLHRLDRLTSQ